MNTTTQTSTLHNGIKITYTYTVGRYGLNAQESHAVTVRTLVHPDGRVSESVDTWCNSSARRRIHSVSETEAEPTAHNVTCAKCLKKL